MSTALSDERMPLTYHAPCNTRFFICLSIPVLGYAYMRYAPDAWTNLPGQHPDAQGVRPFAWWLMLPIITMLFAFVFALAEGLFLIGRKMQKTKLEFDADYLYVTKDDEGRKMPLRDVRSLRLVYGKSFFDTARLLFRRRSS